MTDKPTPDWPRRSVLMAMASLAVAPPGAVDAHARVGADPLGLGVAGGDPGHGGFVLWTRLVGAGAESLHAAAVEVRYERATDQGFRHINWP